jgi:hypothetical protein
VDSTKFIAHSSEQIRALAFDAQKRNVADAAYRAAA